MARPPAVHALRLVPLVVAVVLRPLPAAGQLPRVDASLFTLGEGYVAAARGHAALGSNPANLALSGNPRFSTTLLSLLGFDGFSPISATEILIHIGRRVPDQVRDEWIDTVTLAGGQAGVSVLEATPLSLQLGRVGVQISSRAAVLADLSVGAVEPALLYRDTVGSPDVGLVSHTPRLEGAIVSTAAVGGAHALDLGRAGRLALGLTLKGILGHSLAHGRGGLGVFAADTLRLHVMVPFAQTPDGRFVGNGHGFGLDLGIGWERGPWSVGLALYEVVNTFRWKTSGLRLGRMRATADLRSGRTALRAETDVGPAGPPYREAVGSLGFHPAASAAIAVRPVRRLLLCFGARAGGGDTALQPGPPRLASVGAEIVLPAGLVLHGGTDFLPRGTDFLAGGKRWSVGGSFSFGGFRSGMGVARQQGSSADGPAAVFSPLSASTGTRQQ